MLFRDRERSLCENVIQFGWPQLKLLKDKFIFCLSGTNEWKEFYASGDLFGRLCFSDKDFDDGDKNVQPPSRGNFVFFNTNLYSDKHDVWKVTIPRFGAKNLIVRAYQIDGETLWQNATNAGVSALATDQISGKSWATVGDSAFALRV